MIVIPMAGLSSRFLTAGYELPKYMLKAHGKTLFEHSIESFSNYFSTQEFLFIVKDIFDTKKFVETMTKKMGILRYHVACLEDDTRGQAETVILGLKSAGIKNSTPITIFNIDTFRPCFKYPKYASMGSGYLEVFKGEGENWSFILPSTENGDEVARTAEKEQISNLCSTGLYHFTSVSDYFFAYNEYIEKPVTSWAKGELYVAPLYNILISNGMKVYYHIIDREQVIFCGVPKEYEVFRRQ